MVNQSDIEIRLNAILLKVVQQRDNFANELANLHGELAVATKELDALRKNLPENTNV